VNEEPFERLNAALEGRYVNWFDELERRLADAR